MSKADEIKLSGSSAAEPVQCDLQSLIDNAIASKARVLRIPPGEYRVAAPDLNGPHLKFMEAADLKIDARGVRLICQSPSQGIVFYRCRNIALTGLTLDFEPLRLTQGVITAIAADRSWTEVRIDEGYPDPILNAPGQAFYWTCEARTLLLKPGAGNRIAQAITPRGGRVFRIDHGPQRLRPPRNDSQKSVG